MQVHIQAKNWRGRIKIFAKLAAAALHVLLDKRTVVSFEDDSDLLIA